MRTVGWLVSLIGLVGAVACNALAPMLWVLRADLRARSQDLLAIPELGLEAASALTSRANEWMVDASTRVDVIGAKASSLAKLKAGPAQATAAADLATAIDEFVTGPYATLRTVYTGLHERAMSVSEALGSVAEAVPFIALPGLIADRLAALDARMDALDQAIGTVSRLGPTGLAAPGMAATVAERAAAMSERLVEIRAALGDIEGWVEDGFDRVEDADRRAARWLTIGAVAGTAVSLFVAWLNVLLFQQGRRWSRGA